VVHLRLHTIAEPPSHVMLCQHKGCVTPCTDRQRRRPVDRHPKGCSCSAHQVDRAGVRNHDQRVVGVLPLLRVLGAGQRKNAPDLVQASNRSESKHCCWMSCRSVSSRRYETVCFLCRLTLLSMHAFLKISTSGDSSSGAGMVNSFHCNAGAHRVVVQPSIALTAVQCTMRLRSTAPWVLHRASSTHKLASPNLPCRGGSPA